MKILIINFFVLIASVCFSQNSEVNLEGSIFTGTASEITSPDADRMPLVYNETIKFSGDKIQSDFLDKYSAGNCSYSAVVDERRMIAVTVVNLQYVSEGVIEGNKVFLLFNGNIIGGNTLTGILTMINSDSSEIKFSIVAEKK